MQGLSIYTDTPQRTQWWYFHPLLTAAKTHHHCSMCHRSTEVLGFFAVLWSDRNCPGHNPTDMCVRLPEGNAPMMRHPPRQDTLFGQLLSFRVPAQYCRDDFVLFISAPGDKQLVVARRNPTTGSLMGELGHQAPCIFLRAVGVECFHGPTWRQKEYRFALAIPVRDFN